MGETKQLPATFRESLNFPFIAFKLVGINLYPSPNSCFFKKYLNLIILCLVSPTLLAEVVYVFIEPNLNIKNYVESMGCILIIVIGAAKLVILGMKTTQIREIIEEIAVLWPTMNDHYEYNIMYTLTRKLNKLNNCAFTAAALGIILNAITPLLTTFYYITVDNNNSTSKYMYPNPLYYPWKIDNILKYVLSYIFQALPTGWLNFFLFLPCDLLIVTVGCYISVLFYLLQRRLENDLQFKSYHQSKTEKFGKSQLRKLEKLVQSHQILIRLAERINDAFGYLFFCILSSSSFSICCYGFLAVTSQGSDRIRSIFILTAMCFEVLYVSVPGQLLHDMSLGIADVAYASSWYHRDVKFKKLILVIIMRAQKPCLLSAVGFWDVTLKTFSRVMSRAWSYLSVILQVYNSNQ